MSWRPASRVSVVLDEPSLPCAASVRGACELLGLDPLHVANEGKLLIAVGREHAESATRGSTRAPLGREAACIGEVVSADGDTPIVRMRSLVGGERVVAIARRRAAAANLLIREGRGSACEIGH
jgi:hydrogenase expression/formation protein HypE